MLIKSAALTDVGKKREHNEDNFFYGKEYNIFSVADGMGGAAAGEVASEIVASTMANISVQRLTSLKCTDSEYPEMACTILSDTIKAANSAIQDEVKRSPAKAGMGSTCVAACFDEGRIHTAHVGDSRIYRLRNNILTQITEDHSWVNESVKQGVITPEEAINHKFKNIITRAVGTKPQVLVDTQTLGTMSGDIYFLCSDGVQAGNVTDDDLKKIMISNQKNPDALVKQVIDAANKGGGPDNITCIAVNIEKTTERPALLSAEQPSAGRGLFFLFFVSLALIVIALFLLLMNSGNRIPAPDVITYKEYTNSDQIIVTGKTKPGFGLEFYIKPFKNTDDLNPDNSKNPAKFTFDSNTNTTFDSNANTTFDSNAKSSFNSNIKSTFDSNAQGEWKVTLPCGAEGKYKVSVKAINKKGIRSSAEASYIFHVDRSAPDQINIISPVENFCTSKDSFVLKGIVEKNAILDVTLPLIANQSSTAIQDQSKIKIECNLNGEFEQKISISGLKDGHHQLLISATDRANNKSRPRPFTFEIDRTGPKQPQIIFPVKDSPVRTTNFTIRLLSKNSKSVHLIINGGESMEALREGNSDIYTLEIRDLMDASKHMLEVYAYDSAGNKSTQSEKMEFMVSTKLPPEPIIISPEKKHYTNKGITISGTAQADTKVIIYLKGLSKNKIETNSDEAISPLGKTLLEVNTKSDSKGKWQIDIGPEDLKKAQAQTGETDILIASISARIFFNNLFSKYSDEIVLIYDTQIPELPIFENNNTVYTSQASFSINGTSEPGATLQLFSDKRDSQNQSQQMIDSLVTVNSEFAFKKTNLKEGKNKFLVKIFDAAGNSNPSSAPIYIILDTVSPEKPVITGIEAVTDKNNLTISGTGEANSSLCYLITSQTGKNRRGEVPIDSSSRIEPFTVELENGIFTMVYWVLDKAGNQSTHLTSAFKIVEKMPIKPKFDKIPVPLKGPDNMVTITGKCSPSLGVAIEINGDTPVNTKCDSKGLFRAVIYLENGENKVKYWSFLPENKDIISTRGSRLIRFRKVENTPVSDLISSTDTSPVFAPVNDALKKKLEQASKNVVHIPKPVKMVNINIANAQEISTDLDIPISIANKIVEYRQKMGEYKKPSQTLLIPGMDKKYEETYYGYIRHCIDTRSNK